MKRNPHPDLVRAHLKRWRTRLIRACNEVVKLEKALVRAEAKRAQDARSAQSAARSARRKQLSVPAFAPARLENSQ